MKEIEKKGALFFDQEDKLDDSPLGGGKKKKFMPKINQTAQLSDRLKDMLFNRRDEGYYFRKFQKEKSLENQQAQKMEQS
jgi:hypothetical protein